MSSVEHNRNSKKLLLLCYLKWAGEERNCLNVKGKKTPEDLKLVWMCTELEQFKEEILLQSRWPPSLETDDVFLWGYKYILKQFLSNAPYLPALLDVIEQVPWAQVVRSYLWYLATRFAHC